MTGCAAVNDRPGNLKNDTSSLFIATLSSRPVEVKERERAL